MLTTLEMFSAQEKSVVTWEVTLEEEEGEGGHIHKAIVARHKEEEHRFSPNTTDAELLQRAAEVT